MVSVTLLELPTEIRLNIYDIFIANLRGGATSTSQPSNEHLRLSQICRRIYLEARPLLWQYISLRTERQIQNFIASVREELTTLVRYADVANDGRMLFDVTSSKKIPVSCLHVAVQKMTGLSSIRVFEAREGTIPVSPQDRFLKVIMDMERAMLFGNKHLPKARLVGYELYLDSHSNIETLFGLSPGGLQVLRLSGHCVLPQNLQLTYLKHLTVHSVTGTCFDRHGISLTLGFTSLTSFFYAETQTLGYEIRDQHLHDLISQCAGTLQSLALLRCSHLSNSAVASCLRLLHSLRYLAISYASPGSLNSELVQSIPAGIRTLKLSVSNRKHWQPISDEELGACRAIGALLLTRHTQLQSFHVNLRQKLVSEGWSCEWQKNVRHIRFSFSVYSWEEQEIQ